ncbi:MAG TPA: hypothetical protein VGW36_07475 [Pyrinomonadaceae bacterium]|nr:hypothetical protein [Pyrinomonadaceae bacterium]
MKRCPECEFIYENEQNICDMDGRLLIFDPSTLSIEATSQETPQATPKTPSRSRWKFLLVLLLPILGILVPVVFHGSRNPDEGSANANYSAPPTVESSASQNLNSDPAGDIEPVSDLASPESQPVESELPAAIKTSSPSIKEAEIAKMSSRARLNANAIARANARSIGSSRAQNGGIQMVVVASERSGTFATHPVNNVNRSTSAQRPPANRKGEAARGSQGRIQTVAVGKKESRFGSLLKKTSRILTKPFRR